MDDGEARGEAAEDRAGFRALDLHSMPGHLIRRLQQIAVGIWLEEVGDSPVRPLQHGVLRTIEAVPGIDQMQLSRLMAIDRSTAQDLVQRMEKRGWVARSRDRKDRRRRILTLTRAGSEVLKDIRAANARAQERILAPLSDVERVAFMATLSKIVFENNGFSRAPYTD